jgi:hypothetical protein
VRVCKTFYIHTLAISEGIAHHVLNTVSEEGILKRDSRGIHHNKKALPNRTRESIREHIITGRIQ